MPHKNPTVSAIIAARGGSVRLPRKALLPWDGTTLIGNKVRQLLACPLVTQIAVNTDDIEIAEAALEAVKCRSGCGVTLIDGRDYAGNTREMIRDSVRQVEGDVILWAHPTNPLVDTPYYTRALAEFLDDEGGTYDSLCSVTAVRRHAWYEERPLNHYPWGERHQLAAELAPVYFQNGAIFIQRREAMLENGCFYGESPRLFELDAEVGVDIDTDADYRQAQQISAFVRAAMGDSTKGQV